jgi:DNA-binding protein H-NS
VWFQEALKSGRTKEELLVKAGANGAAPQAPVGAAAQATPKRKGARKSAVKKAGVIRYRDDQGNTWSGFGPQPRWLKAALAGGKALADLAA